MSLNFGVILEDANTPSAPSADAAVGTVHAVSDVTAGFHSALMKGELSVWKDWAGPGGCGFHLHILCCLYNTHLVQKIAHLYVSEWMCQDVSKTT